MPDPTTPVQEIPSVTRSIPNLQDLTDTRIQQPELPQGATINPVYQTAQANEDLKYIGVDPKATNQTASTATATNSTVTNQQTADTSALQQPGAGQYQASTVDPNALPQVQGQHAQFTEDELMSGQLAKLITPDENGQFPKWAAPALTRIQQELAARGIDNSSMAGQAITSALLDAAMPIAQNNAAALQNIKLVNLNNDQQAALVNHQSKITALLSNQSAENASKQFNASSETQVNEFMAQMADSVAKFNATAANTINTFNAQQTTQTSLANAQMTNQMKAANAQLENAREQFNVNNANLIQQSNAQWRRQLNTQNTALANEDARINALNKLQISNDAYDKVWQQFRDEATWMYESSQNDADRATQMAMLVKQYQLIGSNTISEQDNTITNDMWKTIGNVGSKVIGGSLGGLFDSSGGDDLAGLEGNIDADLSNPDFS